VAVEVRHRSWDRPWLPRLLAEAGAGLVLADRPRPIGAPPWGSPDPSGEPLWPQRSNARYLRLLGDRRATPQIGRLVRDRAADLDRWAALVAAAPTGRGPVAVFVNNRYEGAAFETAAALRRRLGQPSPDPPSLWPNPPLPGLAPDYR
jgi:uncharacterized protein YecE (DUF72 family)